MYATIEDVRNFVGSKYTDPQIESMLKYTENSITSVVGDISYWIKTENISVCKAAEREIFLKNIQVRSIISVDWKEYTHSYKIMPPQNRAVEFEELYSYISFWKKSDYFTIKYVSWYNEIPEDIKMAHALYTAEALADNVGMPISKYKMWPRSVEYDTSWNSSYLTKANQILSKYKILVV